MGGGLEYIQLYHSVYSKDQRETMGSKASRLFLWPWLEAKAVVVSKVPYVYVVLDGCSLIIFEYSIKKS
jgi:hypothetical protein